MTPGALTPQLRYVGYFTVFFFIITFTPDCRFFSPSRNVLLVASQLYRFVHLHVLSMPFNVPYRSNTICNMKLW